MYLLFGSVSFKMSIVKYDLLRNFSKKCISEIKGEQ